MLLSHFFHPLQCHVFIQEDGERSILMAPATTSCIDKEAVQKYFGQLLNFTCVLPVVKYFM